VTVGIGFSIFLFVVGAILTFALEVEASGFNLNYSWDHPDGWRPAWIVCLGAVLEQLLAMEPTSDGGRRGHGRRGAPYRARSPLTGPRR
jgi:hypothetical protein